MGLEKSLSWEGDLGIIEGGTAGCGTFVADRRLEHLQSFFFPSSTTKSSYQDTQGTHVVLAGGALFHSVRVKGAPKEQPDGRVH
jgi:hypothetical protein